MKKLKSEKITLPDIYYVSDRKEIKDIPIGVPFIYGDEKTESQIIRLLEFEVLYQKALSTGYPFDFKELLREAGYDDLTSFSYSHPIYMEHSSSETKKGEYVIEEEGVSLKKDDSLFKAYAKDAAVYVDISKLKKLNVFPIWLKSLEESISVNIQNFTLFNPYMYNKKLEGVYGDIETVGPDKNLIIIDISGSIPKGVSATCLTLAKNLSENFYADVLITGSKSTLYDSSIVHQLDVTTLYSENGEDNDQVYFVNLISKERKKYKTAIVFGDNHSPGYPWKNEFNKDTYSIGNEEGQKLCKWEVDKVISFHTSSSIHIAGYANFFEPKEVEKIKDWVKYLN